MKKTKTKKSASIDQNKIKVLCDAACDRIEDLLNHFDLEYKINSKFVSMSCPIHGGDNDTALNLYYTGDTYRGNWKCRTHHCEEHFKSSIIGFVRGILSKYKFNWGGPTDQSVSFNEALEYVTNFLNLDIKDIQVSSLVKEKTNFIASTKILASEQTKPQTIITRSVVRKNLTLPSQYFLSRGFSQSILDRYDVGECMVQNKEMYGRAVVPIYDNDYTTMVGCTGRSIFEKCNNCKCYHNPEYDCPNEKEQWKFSKWKHSFGFKTQEYLYNFWFAKQYIQNNNIAILVESPGNVWKLEQNGIHNSLAIFGSSLSDRQKMILDTSGAMALVLIMDSDEAGEKAREQITKKCNRTYNIYDIRVSKNDIAEMTEKEIKTEILSKLENL